MSRETFRARVRELFADAIEMTPAERRSFVEAKCADDGELLAEVLELLESFTRAGDYLADPAVELAPGERPGDVIDRYELIEQLGEGGFGLVYRAEQRQPIQREVALKIIKLGMDTRQVVARFEAERQTLASMDHPSIARVLDAGATPSGRPYFVMELVRGEPITTFCDAHALSIPDRLELFTRVCDAVQHAHQNGVIHRDLKPSNILVSLVDGKPWPKVIDFGIAKAMATDAGRQATATSEGQFIGTPEYMSPEQAGVAEGGPADVDTRTDIYSLGVLLYQLLTGALPFDRRTRTGHGLLGVHRPALDLEPPRPSTRLRSMEPDACAAAAKARRTERNALARRLRGDLDWVTMKAMAPERSRRYASASELSADVQRYLQGEPVLARPPSLGYVAVKFVRRNTGLVMAAALVLLVLVGGIVATSVAMFDAQRQRDAAQRLAYQASIAGASGALAVGDARRASELLAGAPEAFRAFEWGYLARQADASSVLATSPPLRRFTLHPDGRTLLVDAFDSIRAWDLDRGEQRIWIDFGAVRPSSTTFSPDGTRLLVGVLENGIWTSTLYDWPEETERWRRRGAPGQRPFSPDGRLVALSDGVESRVVLIDVEDGRELRSWSTPHVGVVEVSFESPELLRILDRNHRVVRTVSIDGSVDESWNPPLWGREIDVVDDSLLLVDPESGAIIVNRLGEDRAHTRIPNPGEPLSVVPVTDLTGIGLLSAANGTLYVIDVESGTLLTKLHGHSRTVNMAASLDGGRRLLTGGLDGVLRSWPLPVADVRTDVPVYSDSSRVGAFLSRDGRLLASGGWGTMQLWDTRSTDLIWGTNIGSKYVEFGDFSPDSDRIILAETVGAIVLLDASDGTMIWRRDGCEAGHTGVAWSSREEDIYVACGDGSVRVLDAGTGEERRRWSAHDGPVTDMALSADGSTLVTCAGATLIAGDNWARLITADPGTPALAVWEAESGRLRRRDTSFSSGLTAVALAHDGSMLAVGDAAGRVVVQPVEEGPPHLDRELPHGSIEAIAFSHDRERLAVATSDGRTTILDVASGGELLTLPMDIRTHALAFTPDDETLIAGSRSPFTIYETRRPPGELIERRRLMARARAIVEPMFEEVWLAQALAAALREDMTLPDALRDAAVAYVTRRGDAFAHLVSVSVITARDPKYPLERMRRALKAMQMIREHGRAPARAYDEIIALLHYRVGDYESAAREMQRYLTWDERPDRDGAAELAIVAMIEQARGRRAEALDAWRRAEEANARAGRFSNETAAMIWTEAAAIFGGREG